MVRIEFQNFIFEKNNDVLGVNFLKSFYFEIPIYELEKIGLKNIGSNFLEFERNQEHKLNFILSKYMPNLINKLNKRPTNYIHKDSGIPLMGCLYFGIVDKGSNAIEIKPNTGCNISCVFCSVNEGQDGNRMHDFVVECDYLIEETKKLIEFKKAEYKGKIDVYINPHGEPMLYADIMRLINGLRSVSGVGKIIMITNGTLLSKAIIGQLEESGLSQLNLSISTFDMEKAIELMGTKAYNIEKIKEIIKYTIKESNIKVVITPVYLNKINDEDIEKILVFAKEIRCNHVGIQNFLINKRGKKPAKEMSWDKFYAKLKKWEEKYDMNLTPDLKLDKTKEYPKPFEKGQTIYAEVMCDGRTRNEKIAVAKQRCILVPKCLKNGKIKVKIIKSMHNIFAGEII